MEPTERKRLVKSEARRATVTQVSLGFCALGGGLTALLSMMFVFNPVADSRTESGGVAALSMGLLALAMIVWFAAMFSSMVSYLFWLYRAHQAAEAVEAGSRTNTPWSATLSFFVPFLNLIRPYEAVKALYLTLDPSDLPAVSSTPQTAADMGAAYRENPQPQAEFVSPPAPLSAWWTFWIGGNITLNLVGHVAEGQEFSRASATTWMVASLIETVAAVLCLMVVRAVSARVQERDRRLSLRAF